MNFLDKIRVIKEQQAHLRQLKREIKNIKSDVEELFKLITDNVDVEKHCMPLSKDTLVKGQIVVIKDNDHIIVGEIDYVLTPPHEEYDFILHNNVAYKSTDAYLIIKNN